MGEAAKAPGVGRKWIRLPLSIVLVAAVSLAVIFLLRRALDPHRRQVRAWLRAVLEEQDGSAASQLASDSAFDEENVLAFAQMLENVDRLYKTSPALTAAFPRIAKRIGERPDLTNAYRRDVVPVVLRHLASPPAAFELGVVTVLRHNRTPEAFDAVVALAENGPVLAVAARRAALKDLIRYTWTKSKRDLIDFYDGRIGSDDEELRFMSICALAKVAAEDGCPEALVVIRRHLQESDDEVVKWECLHALAMARVDDTLALAKAAFRSAKTWNLRSRCMDVFASERATEMVHEVRAYIRDGTGGLETDEKAVVVSQYADLMGVSLDGLRSDDEQVAAALENLEAVYQERFGAER